ncbi:transposase [Autumnicola musiva]|uniref:transposase n=1 Tax=Autumnicola musiva TaxID=3075589 RepID=UPI003D779EAE
MLPNWDSKKQLLARSRYLLYKALSNWTTNQQPRAKLLFKTYPDIQQAYSLVNQLRSIFNENTEVKIAYTKLAHWYRDVEESGFKAFNTVANSISLNYRSILNYFNNRSTNVSTESKAFRAQFRGSKKCRILSIQIDYNFCLNTTIRLDPKICFGSVIV